MNKPLRRVSVLSMLLILALMINSNYLQGFEAEEVKNKPGNGRLIFEQYSRDRGPIVAGNEILAQSEDTGKRLRYQRRYREGEVFSPVTGYYATFSKTAIENAANSLLDGTDSRLAVRRWFDSLVGRPPKGATVETTVNPDAQRIAYRALASSTDRRAAAIALDVETGKILVMASSPSYDTNLVATNDTEKANKAFKELEEDELGKPTLNKAIDETFPPGSSFKIVTAAAAMEAQGLSSDSVVPTGPLALPESGRPLPNSHDGGSCGGSATLINAFAESCNTTFARLALDMGATRLSSEADKFGFGQRIPIEEDYSGSASVVPADAGPDDLARGGIGQSSVTASPLQMAMVAAAVANGGAVMKPYVIDKVKSPDQSILREGSPQELSRAMSEGTADQLRAMMTAVTQPGGTAVGDVSSDIAGKTGTAETGRGFNARWFVGFAPANDPKIAFAVVTEGPGFAADTAGPIAETIVRAL